MNQAGILDNALDIVSSWNSIFRTENVSVPSIHGGGVGKSGKATHWIYTNILPGKELWS